MVDHELCMEGVVSISCEHVVTCAISAVRGEVETLSWRTAAVAAGCPVVAYLSRASKY